VRASSAVILAIGSVAVMTPTNITAPASAMTCNYYGQAVIRPTLYRAYGLGTASCTRPSSICVWTDLMRGNRSIARGNRCGNSPMQVATPWAASNPGERLWISIGAVAWV
jgi:hypothetical protein